MKRLYILWMGILLILAATHLRAQVVFNATNFPDANFRQWLKDNFRSYGFTTEGVTVSAANLNSITSINCSSGTNISNLKGIEYFTQLNELWCGSNYLTTTPNFTKNTKLTALGFSGNMGSLDLSRNTNLTELLVTGENLTMLNLSYNTKLQKLTLQKTSLAQLDLSKNTALIYLKLYTSNLSLTSLDLSKNTELIYLYLPTEVTSIDLSKCTKLKALYGTGSKLTSLKLGANSSIEFISFNNSFFHIFGICPLFKFFRCSDCNSLTMIEQAYSVAIFSFVHVMSNQNNRAALLV